MKKRNTFLAVATVIAFGLSLPAAAKRDNVGGPPAGAGQDGKPLGIACQQAGIATLQSLGLLAAVANDGIEVVGLGNVPFETVLSLHRTTPEAFQTGGVTVVVPELGEVPATWCDHL
jgi:hypothetical protein